MTDKSAKTPFEAARKGPPGLLEYDGAGKTITIDSGVFAYATNDVFLDFLSMAELQGYRVVVQSKSPSTDLTGFLDKRMQDSARLKTFFENRKTSRPVLLAGSPEVNRTQAPYLHITNGHAQGVNVWNPTDKRIELSVEQWASGQLPPGEHTEAVKAFYARALDRLKPHRRDALALHSKLAEEMTKAGMDFNAFKKGIEESRFGGRPPRLKKDGPGGNKP